jgi:hypothetical protein
MTEWRPPLWYDPLLVALPVTAGGALAGFLGPALEPDPGSEHGPVEAS